MALKIVKKVNSRLRFLYRKGKFLSPPLRRMLCNALIQPHFDYACLVWYSKLTQALKNKISSHAKQMFKILLTTKSLRSHRSERVSKIELVECQ